MSILIKTQLPLRDQLVTYEREEIESQLNTLVEKITGSESTGSAFVDEILALCLLLFSQKH